MYFFYLALYIYIFFLFTSYLLKNLIWMRHEVSSGVLNTDLTELKYALLLMRYASDRDPFAMARMLANIYLWQILDHFDQKNPNDHPTSERWWWWWPMDVTRTIFRRFVCFSGNDVYIYRIIRVCSVLIVQLFIQLGRCSSHIVHSSTRRLFVLLVLFFFLFFVWGIGFSEALRSQNTQRTHWWNDCTQRKLYPCTVIVLVLWRIALKSLLSWFLPVPIPPVPMLSRDNKKGNNEKKNLCLKSTKTKK